MLRYDGKLIARAKELRKNMTPWEIKLWTQFLREYPVRFQRQKVIGNSIVDFYCAKARLVVELDGGGHYLPQRQLADAQRAKALEALGLRVLRFCNTDVDGSFYEVCTVIDNTVQQTLAQRK